MEKAYSKGSPAAATVTARDTVNADAPTSETASEKWNTAPPGVMSEPLAKVAFAVEYAPRVKLALPLRQTVWTSRGSGWLQGPKANPTPWEWRARRK